MTRVHGGPDAAGAARWDFSTNANSCGPCPLVMDALRAADVSRYPDPRYQALRKRLAAWHGAAPGRIVLAASASEFIVRMTAVSAGLAPGAVAVPRHAYGDYSAAARAQRRPVTHEPAQASLVWHCEPSSPFGQATSPPALHAGAVHVLDRAYAPLQINASEAGAWPEAALDAVFQLFSPNKALGVPGIRGAYAIAPLDATAWTQALDAAAPSWPLGAHAAALLDAWPDAPVQRWLSNSHATLREWKQLQVDGFTRFGFEPAPSATNFFCARAPSQWPLTTLREHGIALRDGASFGLPGWVRASVQPPPAQQALWRAIGHLQRTSDA